MKHRLATLAAALLLAAPVAGRSAAAPSTVEEVVAHHLSTASAGDVDGLIGDYAESATLILPDSVVKGKAAIRAMFATLLANKSAPPLVLDKKAFAGDVGYITWAQNAGKPGEVRGSDTFVVQDGKILVQTVMMVPVAAPPK